jgi:hypothetical protein
MNNKNILILSVLGLGGYLAYTMYQKSQNGSTYGYGTGSGSGSGSGSGNKGKTIDVQKGLDYIDKLLNAGNQIYFTINKTKIITDLKSLIEQGKNQQYIEIFMKNKYNLQPAQVSELINKLYL